MFMYMLMENYAATMLLTAICNKALVFSLSLWFHVKQHVCVQRYYNVIAIHTITLAFLACEVNFYNIFAICSYKQILTAQYLLKVTSRNVA